MNDLMDPHKGISPDVRRELAARAERLASPEPDAVAAFHATSGTRHRYLIFQLVDQRCGLDLRHIREVIALQSVISVPSMPSHVVGLTRIRGAVLALIDLRRFWTPNPRGHRDSDFAVVVETRGIEFGILCSAIGELEVLPDEALQPAPANTPTRVTASLRGVANRDLIVLDLERLLAQPGFLLDAGRGD